MPSSLSEEIRWLDTVEEHCYPAALSYLQLIFDDACAASLVRQLRSCEMSTFKAKDIFRASQLSLLGVSNSHVIKNREKIAHGKALSPLLLVRSPLQGKVVVADGYHRLCAIYGVDEDANIPCKITSV